MVILKICNAPVGFTDVTAAEAGSPTARTVFPDIKGVPE